MNQSLRLSSFDKQFKTASSSKHILEIGLVRVEFFALIPATRTLPSCRGKVLITRPRSHLPGGELLSTTRTTSPIFKLSFSRVHFWRCCRVGGKTCHCRCVNLWTGNTPNVEFCVIFVFLYLGNETSMTKSGGRPDSL